MARGVWDGPSTALGHDVQLRLLRDTYAWEVGGGPRLLRRGTLLAGTVLRRNRATRRIVLDVDGRLLTLNAEDVDVLGPAAGAGA